MGNAEPDTDKAPAVKTVPGRLRPLMSRRGDAASAGHGVPGGRSVLLASILGSSLAFIDGSVVNVALHAIGVDLAAGIGGLQWVVSGYMLTLASLMLLAGAVGDRWGLAKAFAWGVGLFALASLACALAPNIGFLVGARLLQGAAAALLVPASLALIAASFSGAARGQAIGTWAAASAITAAIGPLVGGLLVDLAGWRMVFLINLPLAAGALLVVARFPPLPRPADKAAADGVGAMLATAGLGLLSIGLITLGNGNVGRGSMAIAAALVTLAGFILHQARARAPMIPLGLFRNRLFAGANVLTVLLYAALAASLVMLPLSLIGAHGFTASQAGAALLPVSVIMGGFSSLSGRLAVRTGPRLPLTLGPLLAAGGFALMAAGAGSASYWSGSLPGLLLLGTGMTIAVPPLTTVVLDSVPEGRSATASSINNVAARTGSLVAIAALGLAFGGGANAASGNGVAQAASTVMAAAALVAVLSAVAGWWATPANRSPAP